MSRIRRVWVPAIEELDDDDRRGCIVYSEPLTEFYVDEYIMIPIDRLWDLSRETLAELGFRLVAAEEPGLMQWVFGGDDEEEA